MRRVVLYEVSETDGGGIHSKVIGIFEHEREAKKFTAGDNFKNYREVDFFEIEVRPEGGGQFLTLLFPAKMDPKASIPDTVIISTMPVYNSCEHYEDAKEVGLLKSALTKLNQEERNAIRKFYKLDGVGL